MRWWPLWSVRWHRWNWGMAWHILAQLAVRLTLVTGSIQWRSATSSSPSRAIAPNGYAATTNRVSATRTRTPAWGTEDTWLGRLQLNGAKADEDAADYSGSGLVMDSTIGHQRSGELSSPGVRERHVRIVEHCKGEERQHGWQLIADYSTAGTEHRERPVV
jgi:hypothetical protein